MGKLIINGPQNINMEYEVVNLEVIKNLIELFKNTEITEKSDDEIVGLWKDRFPSNINSTDIHDTWRNKLWERS
jgi:hypothetical protein